MRTGRHLTTLFWLYAHAIAQGPTTKWAVTPIYEVTTITITSRSVLTTATLGRFEDGVVTTFMAVELIKVPITETRTTKTILSSDLVTIIPGATQKPDLTIKPAPSSSPSTPAEVGAGKAAPSTGLIAGIAVVAVLIAAVVGFFMYKRFQRKKKSNEAAAFIEAVQRQSQQSAKSSTWQSLTQRSASQRDVESSPQHEQGLSIPLQDVRPPNWAARPETVASTIMPEPQDVNSDFAKMQMAELKRLLELQEKEQLEKARRLAEQRQAEEKYWARLRAETALQKSTTARDSRESAGGTTLVAHTETDSSEAALQMEMQMLRRPSPPGVLVSPAQDRNHARQFEPLSEDFSMGMRSWSFPDKSTTRPQTIMSNYTELTADDIASHSSQKHGMQFSNPPSPKTWDDGRQRSQSFPVNSGSQLEVDKLFEKLKADTSNPRDVPAGVLGPGWSVSQSSLVQEYSRQGGAAHNRKVKMSAEPDAARGSKDTVRPIQPSKSNSANTVTSASRQGNGEVDVMEQLRVVQGLNMDFSKATHRLHDSDESDDEIKEYHQKSALQNLEGRRAVAELNGNQVDNQYLTPQARPFNMAEMSRALRDVTPSSSAESIYSQEQ